MLRTIRGGSWACDPPCLSPLDPSSLHPKAEPITCGYRLILVDHAFRVVRAGSWLSSPCNLRSGMRIDSLPFYCYNGSGYRLMLEGAP